MIQCPSCSRPNPENSLYCGLCGGKLPSKPSPGTDASAADQVTTPAQAATVFEAPPVSSHPSLDVRFPPGTMLAGRYRVVGMLGQGGMGEVYRADDLKLGRPVALKFLPEAVAQDPHRLSRFLNEVRVALQVSHPNVCRVHDIGELDGQHYISMEYVDGEDLASLLKRIGRFPEDRAIQAARQLCAGLAAAHGQGILHRDLKPANVMIDGRGQAKITDFGLASLAEELKGEEIGAGTPAYMAPEQIAGTEVTQRSDIYALGLVLYELFTGKPALECRTPADLARRGETTPTSPSSHVSSLDPAVERIILRCLEPDPANRPASALAVAAALPGGDPLAAALAAGETPSPELVAEAGASGGLRSAPAMLCLLGVLITAVLHIAFAELRVLPNRANLDTPPEVLVAKARQLVRDFGYEDPPLDEFHCFYQNSAYMRHLVALDPPLESWEFLSERQPASVMFGYRRSPRHLTRDAGLMGSWMTEPAQTLPGMVQAHLDLEGRLVFFSAVPPAKAEEDIEASRGGGDPNALWTQLLVAGGFDPAQLTPVEPLWTPPVFADIRAAWEGVYPDAPEVPVRLEAASYEGRPVAFQIVEPWTRPFGASPLPRSFWARARELLDTIWFAVVLAAASLVALRNLRLGRGDRRTALRFALYLGAVRLLWLLGAHHFASRVELGLFTGHLAWALYRVGLVYVFYLALEPYARRLWPHMLVSWVRLMSGRFRDPLVGRDLLVGVLYGALSGLIISIVDQLPEIMGVEGYGLQANVWTFEALRGLRQTAGAMAGVHTQTLLFMFVGIMMFLVLRLLLRRTWIAALVFMLMGAVIFNPGTGHPLPFIIGFLVIMGGFWFVLFRFGLLSLLLGFSVSDLLRAMPLTFDLGAWYSHATLMPLLFTLGVAVWGFRVALAGRPLFKDEIMAAEPPLR